MDYFDTGENPIAGPHSGSRVLPLEGGRNFRDLGGYRTADGRRVRWGKIFRSGNMAGLTPADFDYLSKLEIRTICDLRTTGERELEPNKWHQVANIAYWSREYETGFGEIRKLLGSESNLATAMDARNAMLDGYRRLPFHQAVAYKELFARLAAGQIPLVVNCSAGKDRAGMAAAIVLSALGVPREAVVQDYLLTEKTLDTRVFTEGAHDRKGALGRQPREVTAAILTADAGYLHAALDAIEEKHGTLTGYLQDELAVTPQALGVIQASLLEKDPS
jgi:protein-tyrosine phosphatase